MIHIFITFLKNVMFTSSDYVLDLCRAIYVFVCKHVNTENALGSHHTVQYSRTILRIFSVLHYVINSVWHCRGGTVGVVALELDLQQVGDELTSRKFNFNLWPESYPSKHNHHPGGSLHILY